LPKPKNTPRPRQVLVDEWVHSELGHLAVDTKRPVKDLVEEAVIKQYGLKPAKTSRLVPARATS